MLTPFQNVSLFRIAVRTEEEYGGSNKFFFILDPIELPKWYRFLANVKFDTSISKTEFLMYNGLARGKTSDCLEGDYCYFRRYRYVCIPGRLLFT